MKFFINNYAYPGLVDALIRRGHEVLGQNGGYDQFNWWQHLMNDNKTNDEYDEILRGQIKEHMPDVFLCGKGWHNNKFVRNETVEWIRSKGIRTIYWSLDDPDFIPFFTKFRMYRGYDIILTCDENSIFRYLSTGVKDVHLFWPAYDQVEWKQDEQVEEKDMLCDFLMVCSPYLTTRIPRRDMALAISKTDLDFHIYGPEMWTGKNGPRGLGGYPELQSFYKGYWNNRQKLGWLFSHSRMNVSNHLHVSKNYLNDRVPMVMGSGGFLFLDRQPGFETTFHDKKEVVYFDSARDLSQKAVYYCKAVDERRRIAENGRELILRDHTYESRAEQLLCIIEGFDKV